MFSLCGRNALFCSRRFGFSVSDILSSDFNCNIVKELCLEATTSDDLATVFMLMELTFIRDGTFSASGFTSTDINGLISSIATM
jgi:hypothetical protein